MSLRSVTDEILSITNGKVFGNFPACQAYADYFPPVQTTTSSPQIYIIAEDGTDERDAMPRTYGLREIKYKVKVYFMAMFMAADTGTLLAPQDIVEGLLDLYRTYPDMMIGLTDAQTGAKSALMDLGEDMEWTMEPPLATKSQRITMFSGVVELLLRELIASA